MTYQPDTATESDRSLTFMAVWAGCAATPIVIASRFLGIESLAVNVTEIAAIGGFLVVVLARQPDDWFRQLSGAGYRALAIFLALYFGGILLAAVYDLAFSLGSAMEVVRPADTGMVDAITGLLNAKDLALGCLASFYAGYAVEHLRR